jgi:DNA topoisomerase I
VHFQHRVRTVEGRTHIEVEATPQTPETRALLREFRAGVRELERNWKAVVKARATPKKAAAKKGAARKTAAKKAGAKKAAAKRAR